MENRICSIPGCGNGFGRTAIRNDGLVFPWAAMEAFVFFFGLHDLYVACAEVSSVDEQLKGTTATELKEMGTRVQFTAFSHWAVFIFKVMLTPDVDLYDKKTASLKRRIIELSSLKFMHYEIPPSELLPRSLFPGPRVAQT